MGAFGGIIRAAVFACERVIRARLGKYIAHAKRRQPVGERIYASARIRSSMSIRPDNIKSRIDVRYGKTMQSGVSQGK